MKTNNKFKTMMMVTVAALAAAACTDTWDEHYGNEGGPVSDKSLLQLVEEAGDLNDFLKVLQSTHVFVNNKPTGVTYADLLASDQTFTVWAPKDGTFNVDSLLAECATGIVGDSMCGQHFVQNHIAHYVTNSTDTKSTIMLNGKYLAAEPGSFEGVSYAAGRSGQPARNGLLHVMSGGLPYLYNIYEGLTTLPEYSGMGAFFKRYEKLELNEAASVASGMVDGNIVYSDSVMDRTNILFGTFQNINEEDSNFIMLVPDAQIWDKVYEEAKGYFNFGSAYKADSLQELYAHLAVIRDLVYNRNYGCQQMADSVYSTSYYVGDEERHHIYYKPLAPGGIFSSSFVRDSMDASNGVFYNLYDWPFTPEDIYFYPVKAEAEVESLLKEYSGCSYEATGNVARDSISDGYLTVTASNSQRPNWTVTFDVPNVLSGTYDVCVVTVPRRAVNPNDQITLPCRFTGAVNYVDESGTKLTQDFEDYCIPKVYEMDTVKVGTFKVPVTSYGQPEANVQVSLTCRLSTTADRRNYYPSMIIDCIYFKPSKEE